MTLSAIGGADAPGPGGPFDAAVSSLGGARPSSLRGGGARSSVTWRSGPTATG
jgi:hypothetical protein